MTTVEVAALVVVAIAASAALCALAVAVGLRRVRRDRLDVG